MPLAGWPSLGSAAELAVWGWISFAAAILFGLLAVLVAARATRCRSELRESQERFRGVFDNSLVGMSISAPGNGRLVRINAALHHMLGYEPGELAGKSWMDITHPDDAAQSMALTRATIAGERRGFTQEKRYLARDGHPVPVLLTCTLLRDERGRPVHFSTQVIDISERRRLAADEQRARAELTAHARQLERANEALQVAQQRTADLVAMLSHDVRQPLGVISGYCELLLDAWDHTDDRQKRRDLSRIAQAGTGMMQLVEEILTLTELDHSDLRPRRTPITVRRAVDQAVDALYPDQRVGLVVTVEAHVAVLADPRHLQQILINLISNARKYGGSEGMWIRADRVGDSVEICVSDRGEGVPAEFQPHLFERFSRAESGVAPTRKGTGLGLYIARHLAEANGGSIRYEPNTPRGSRFLVRLLATMPAAPAQAVAVRVAPG